MPSTALPEAVVASSNCAAPWVLPFEVAVSSVPTQAGRGSGRSWEQHYGSGSAVDHSAARALTRGRREREWLLLLLDDREGLHPSAGVFGKWGPITTAAVVGLVNRLQLAGYVVERRLLASRGGQRFFLAGYRPELAPLLQAVLPRAGFSGQPISVGLNLPTASSDALFAWASTATPAAVETATVLARHYSGPLTDLLNAAEELAR